MRLLPMKFAILLPLSLLCACATAVREPLPTAARDKISSTDVVLPIGQKEIYVIVPNSDAAAAGGGLIAALAAAAVNSIRTSKAETAVRPLRDALVDFDFGETLQGELKHSLSDVPWVHVGDARVITTENWDQVLTSSKASAVLFAQTDYHLSNDGDVLLVSTKVSLFPNEDALRAVKTNDKGKSGSKTAPEHALYRNSLEFKTSMPGATSDRDANIAAWSANNGAAMRAALKQGATKLGMMLADDLQRPPEEMPMKKIGYTKAEGAVRIDGVNGYVIGTDADGEIVRLNDETLAFVTASAMDR
jgi:hypothetical protein